MPDTTELALEANSAAVVRGRLDRVEWSAALRVGVMVVVGEVARAVVVPARRRVDQPAAVHGPDALGNGDLGVRGRPDLAPAFIVDDLDKVLINQSLMFSGCHATYPGDDGGVAHVLVDQDVELALKLCLLVTVGERYTRGH